MLWTLNVKAKKNAKTDKSKSVTVGIAGVRVSVRVGVRAGARARVYSLRRLGFRVWGLGFRI